MGTIYHYTGFDAFLKIIEGGRIRATHYDFEDKEELRLGLRLLLDAVKEHSVEPRDREYKEFLIQGIEGFTQGNLPVYVVSFTETRDSAHHWKNYACVGVAIGFCRGRVQQGFPVDITRRVSGMNIDNPVRPDPANRWMQCRYVTRFDLPELVSRRFFTSNSYPAAFRNQSVRANQTIYSCLSVSIYQTICAIKGEGFFDDEEWRCVNVNPDVEDYPVTTENNRTFIEMQFTRSIFVREVWVGPHDQRQKCEDAIESLRKKGLLLCSASLSSLQ